MTRNDYIGGSDAAAVLGVHDYRTRRAVWESKRGLTIDPDLSDNPHIRRGVFIEPEIERYVREKLDPTVNSPENWTRHDAGIRAGRRVPSMSPDAQIMLLDTVAHPLAGRPIAGGHPDGVGNEILWEFKAPASPKFGIMAASGVPLEWIYQVQHYLRLAKLPLGIVAIWDCDSWSPSLVEVYPDYELHEIMRTEYDLFWNAVVAGDLPTDGSLAQNHQIHVTDDAGLVAAVAEYHDCAATEREASARKKQLRLTIMTEMKNRQTLITPEHTVRVSRSTTKAGNDSARLTISENRKPLEQ